MTIALPFRIRWTKLPRFTKTIDPIIDTFRHQYFNPAQPVVFPSGYLVSLPAASKWFNHKGDRQQASSIKSDYLGQFPNAIVRVEHLTRHDDGTFHFTQGGVPLSLALQIISKPIPSARVYIAQSPISDLPQGLQDDLPAPTVVLEAGRGDVYASSIWLGVSPTRTPLHRDPNPNLFVQLCGTKTIRMIAPAAGDVAFHAVRRTLGQDGGSSAVRIGENMIAGEEGCLTESLVWDQPLDGSDDSQMQEIEGFEVDVKGPGDAVFIPKGWWHSVRSIGKGTNGSVNWWFR